jgi:pilus assembly protein CpaE
MTNVTIVGTVDRQLQELLTEAGMRPKSVDLAALGTLGLDQNLPDIVVLDTRATGNIPPALSTLKRLRPTLPIVIVISALEPALMLDAMRAGVSEVLAEPLSRAELEQAIGRLLGRRPTSEVGQTFGFVGAKGGVGTTTVAVNTAVALARVDRGVRTLLVDIHQAGGDAAVFAGIDPKFSIVDAVENTHRLDDTYMNGLVTPITQGLGLLASSDRPFAASVDPARVRKVGEFLASSYRYVVLDLPRSDAAVLDGIDQATTIFIVANQELATVKSGARLAGTLRQRYGRERVKIVMSRSDRQADIGIADVERTMGAEIAFTFPSDYRLALQALNLGRPLALEPGTDLSAAFKRFAEQLSGRKHDDASAAPARLGLFGRLTQPKRA